MTKKQPTRSAPQQSSRKSVSSADDLIKTTQGGIELTETKLGRVSGGMLPGHALRAAGARVGTGGEVDEVLGGPRELRRGEKEHENDCRRAAPGQALTTLCGTAVF